jgi:3-oxoacyl-[acyl-carrier-protein] synthase-3
MTTEECGAIDVAIDSTRPQDPAGTIMTSQPNTFILGADHLGGVPVRGTQTSETSAGYGNILTASVISCLPAAVCGASVPRSGGHNWPDAAQSVAVMGPGQFASDYASAVSQRLVARMRAVHGAPVDALIYCHCALDEATDDTAATRISADLGLDDPLCFSVSQSHNCGVFAALWLAQKLLRVAREPATVLIAAADKWLYPYPRDFGALGMCGDGAGALLLASHPDSTGLRLVHIEPGRSDCLLSDDPSEVARRAAVVVERAMEEAGVVAAQVDTVIHPSLDGRLCSEVACRAGLVNATQHSGVDAGIGHLSSADPIACLSRSWTSSTSAQRPIWVIWGAGAHGEVGCAILELTG